MNVFLLGKNLLVRALYSVFLFYFAITSAVVFANPPVEDLLDLTQGVIPVVQYKQVEPLAGKGLTSVSEVEFIVKVKNQTGDPVVADSLILVVDSVKEISGHDISDRIEVVGSDGMTQDGKPFFRIPNAEQELGPFSESETVVIRVNNPDYLRFFPPNFRVRGIRRSSDEAVKGLLESLVQKGILAPEEAANAMRAPSPPVTSENP